MVLMMKESMWTVRSAIFKENIRVYRFGIPVDTKLSRTFMKDQ